MESFVCSGIVVYVSLYCRVESPQTMTFDIKMFHLIYLFNIKIKKEYLVHM